MVREVKAGETVASRRRVVFQLVETDGITPAESEAGEQPQVSVNFASWTDAGIGVLTHIGNGRYYADLTTGSVATIGDIIETRYASAGTAECPGDTFMVVAHDPYEDIAFIRLKVALISTAGITIRSPVSADGQYVFLVRGDDYLESNGRRLEWFSESWPDLTDAEIEFQTATMRTAGVLVEYGSNPQIVGVELSHTKTAAISPGAIEAAFRVRARWPSGTVVTLVLGVIKF